MQLMPQALLSGALDNSNNIQIEELQVALLHMQQGVSHAASNLYVSVASQLPCLLQSTLGVHERDVSDQGE